MSARPVLFVTNHVPPDRAGAFKALHDRVPIELALFGGRSQHATAGLADPGVPHRHVGEREVRSLAASGRYRAVIAGTAGRRALPGAIAGARRAGVPFVLWSALWAHPRSLAHVATGPLLQVVYRRADAVVTYGPHVSAFVRARGARRIFEAPQAVDGAFWSARPDRVADEANDAGDAERPFTAVFVGREARGKGVGVLADAWRACHFDGAPAALVLVGIRPESGLGAGVAVRATGPVEPEQVRNFLGRADVLVMPSISTPTFREPWGLVANEAMHQHLPVIASDAVGAAAGGLVRHERNGLVVPAGDAPALASALERLRAEPGLRAELGAAAARDVAPYTFGAWAAGFEQALEGLPA